MRVSDNLSVSLKNLFKRKVRTLLTMLAVALATMLIVSVVALGIGMQRSFEQSLQNMSDITKIEIYTYGGNNGKVILDKDVAELNKLEGVQAVTPVLSVNLYGQIGKRVGNFEVVGITPEAFEAMRYPIKEGEPISADGEWEIAVSQNLSSEFMTTREQNERQRQYRSGTYDWSQPAPVLFDVLEGKDKFYASVDYTFIYPQEGSGDETLQEQAKPVKPYTLRPVAIMDGDKSWEFMYRSYMNLDTVKKIFDEYQKFQAKQSGSVSYKLFKDTGYQQIYVKAADIKYVEGLVAQIKEMGYQNVYSPIDYVNEMKKTSENMQGFLGIIGGVVLVVAILMVANTMIMSIYERTREIGVMKVIGASLKDIRNMFLTEAAAIGVMGGAVGLGLSYAVSYVIRKFPDLLKFMQNFSGYNSDGITMAIPPYLALGALAGATFVGIASGYFPARRAMHVSALTAILTQS